MTRREAEELIGRIVLGDVPLALTEHARTRLVQRGFTVHDVRAILRTHTMREPPTRDVERRNFRVTLRGTCLQGRPATVVLGLRSVGPCTLVTIMLSRPERPARRNR